MGEESLSQDVTASYGAWHLQSCKPPTAVVKMAIFCVEQAINGAQMKKENLGVI